MNTVHTAFQLGVATDENVPSTNQAEATQVCQTTDSTLDFFITEEDGISYAGTHLTLDLWGASGLDDVSLITETLLECARVSGATVLHHHFHHFTPNSGVTGVVALAESHISIHTWPERGFAAIDIFMCGDAKPKKSLAILKRAFAPSQMLVNDFKRGLSHHDE